MTDEDEVRAQAASWALALANRDVEAADRILGAEYTLMAPGVGVMTRERWLAMMREYVIHSYEFNEITVHVYGETAVMRSHCRQSATVAGADRSGEVLATDVWIKRDGRWQVVARQAAFV